MNATYKGDGYPIYIDNQEKRKVAQAYADDLLTFTDNRRNLNKLKEAIADFMNFPNRHFNPDLFRIILYNPTKREIGCYLFLKDDMEYGKNVQICGIDDTVNYLGVPLGISKLIKMKFNNQKI